MDLHKGKMSIENSKAGGASIQLFFNS
jgi:hypothetical protein